MKHSLPIATAAVASCFLFVGAEESFRIWKDRSGSHSVEARAVGVTGEEVILETKDGRRINVLLSSLSDADVKLIKSSSGNTIEGVWGGKWDDQWPVFLVVKTGEDGKYDVGYHWYENLNRPMQSGSMTGTKNGSYVETRVHLFRVIDGKLFVYGKFSRPRAARMVKLSITADQLEEVDLAKEGWEEGVPGAEEAKQMITAE